MDFFSNIIGGVTETLQLKMVLDWFTANDAGIGGLGLVGIGLPFTLSKLNKSSKVPWRWQLKGIATIMVMVIYFGILILVGYLIFKG